MLRIVLLISARPTQGSGTTTDHQVIVSTAGGGTGVTSTLAFGARFSAIDDEAANLACRERRPVSIRLQVPGADDD